LRGNEARILVGPFLDWAAAAPVDDDDNDSITNFLDSMIVGVGLRNQVNSGIEDLHQQQLSAERQARFIHVDEDANQVLGASNRDTNYRENMWRLIGGQHEKGYCTVAKCQPPEMELLHKCDTCKSYVHDVLCLMDNNLLTLEEGGPDHHYCSCLCKR
jgi:hypothetical protein